MRNEQKSPWQLGFAACRCGETIHQNPFAPFTTEHSEWQNGWQDYDAHQSGKEEALEGIGWHGSAARITS